MSLHTPAAMPAAMAAPSTVISWKSGLTGGGGEGKELEHLCLGRMDV